MSDLELLGQVVEAPGKQWTHETAGNGGGEAALNKLYYPLPVQVNNVAMSVKTVPFTHEDSPKLKVCLLCPACFFRCVLTANCFLINSSFCRCSAFCFPTGTSTRRFAKKVAHTVRPPAAPTRRCRLLSPHSTPNNVSRAFFLRRWRCYPWWRCFFHVQLPRPRM